MSEDQYFSDKLRTSTTVPLLKACYQRHGGNLQSNNLFTQPKLQIIPQLREIAETCKSDAAKATLHHFGLSYG